MRVNKLRNGLTLHLTDLQINIKKHIFTPYQAVQYSKSTQPSFSDLYYSKLEASLSGIN